MTSISPSQLPSAVDWKLFCCCETLSQEDCCESRKQNLNDWIRARMFDHLMVSQCTEKVSNFWKMFHETKFILNWPSDIQFKANNNGTATFGLVQDLSYCKSIIMNEKARYSAAAAQCGFELWNLMPWKLKSQTAHFASLEKIIFENLHPTLHPHAIIPFFRIVYKNWARFFFCTQRASFLFSIILRSSEKTNVKGRERCHAAKRLSTGSDSGKTLNADY